jgi:hypothetical protein
MMAKPPPDLPMVGNQVRLRGSDRTGVLLDFNPANEWAYVSWDRDTPGPHVCHRFELERLPCSSS